MGCDAAFQRLNHFLSNGVSVGSNESVNFFRNFKLLLATDQAGARIAAQIVNRLVAPFPRKDKPNGGKHVCRNQLAYGGFDVRHEPSTHRLLVVISPAVNIIIIVVVITLLFAAVSRRTLVNGYSSAFIFVPLEFNK